MFVWVLVMRNKERILPWSAFCVYVNIALPGLVRKLLVILRFVSAMEGIRDRRVVRSQRISVFQLDLRVVLGLKGALMLILQSVFDGLAL